MEPRIAALKETIFKESTPKEFSYKLPVIAVIGDVSIDWVIIDAPSSSGLPPSQEDSTTPSDRVTALAIPGGAWLLAKFIRGAVGHNNLASMAFSVLTRAAIEVPIQRWKVKISDATARSMTIIVGNLHISCPIRSMETRANSTGTIIDVHLDPPSLQSLTQIAKQSLDFIRLEGSSLTLEQTPERPSADLQNAAPISLLFDINGVTQFWQNNGGGPP